MFNACLIRQSMKAFFVKVSLLGLFLAAASPAAMSQSMGRPSDAQIASLPAWAQEMYGPSPNLFRVDSLYRAWYRIHPFEKSFHTQYYKRWRRKALPFTSPSGTITYPSEAEMESRVQAHMEKITTGQARSSGWELVGPVTVRVSSTQQGSSQTNVYSLDQCASDPSVMYCGTEPGEVYKSVNGGLNWTNTSMTTFFGGGVTAIEVDPFNPQRVFAGGSLGVFRSLNGGQTWVPVLSNGNLGVNELFIHPANPQRVFAATDRGLYVSLNGGTNWNRAFTQRTFDIKMHPSNPARLYIVKENPGLVTLEFFSSVDSGATWSIQTQGWYNSTHPARSVYGARLAVTPADPDRVYAYLIGDAKPDDFGYIGVYRSNDGGATWTLPRGQVGGPYSSSVPNLAIGWATWTYHQGFYNCALMASETNADEILVGGLNLYKSSDGGASFTGMAGYIGGPLDMHVDMQDFRVINGNYWISTDGGIYASGDFFSSQPRFRMSGIHGSDYWGFGSGWNEDVLVGGLYHNGNLAYYEPYGAGNFLELGGGEAPTGYVNPGNNRRTYFSDIGGKIIPGSLSDPVQNSAFGLSPNESYYPAESSEMEFHPHCYTIAFIGKDHQIWKTTDGGASFQLLFAFGTNPDDEVKYIEISSENPEVMYLSQQPVSGGAGKLWKTTDGGANWTLLTVPAGFSRRMLLSINPVNDDELWLAYPDGSNGSKVFKTLNGGQTWTNLTTSTLDGETAHTIAHIAGTNGGVYLGTDKTVYYRSAAMADWILHVGGLPTFFPANIARPFYRDSKIRIASYGKGIWQADMYELPSVPLARITVDKLSQSVVCRTDSFFFEDYSFLNHAGANWQWNFPTGSPQQSTRRNPAVMFDQPGQHLAVLTITDSTGALATDSLYVSVAQSTVPDSVQETFQAQFPPEGWQLQDLNGGANWTQSAAAGGFGLSTQSAFFNNYNIQSEGGKSDLRFFISTLGSDSAYLTFDVAHAPYDYGIYSDSLQVLVSTDCGVTFSVLYYKGGTTLETAPAQSSEFVPSASQWRKDTVRLDTFTGETQLLVAIRNIGRFGNSIFVDNIQVQQSETSTRIRQESTFPLAIYPNPARAGGDLRLDLPPVPCKVKLVDMKGKTLLETRMSGPSAIQLPSGLSAGAYMVHVESAHTIWNRLIQIR